MFVLFRVLKKIISFLPRESLTVLLCVVTVFIFSPPVLGQISVSPDFKIPEIVVPEQEVSESKKKSPKETQKKESKKGETQTSSHQENTVDDPAANVVVSPTGVVTPVDQVGSSVSVITEKNIETNQWITAPDALRYVPGINVIQTGGVGGLTSIFTRGTNSNHTKVLIDGMDVSDPSTPGRFYEFGQLTTWDLSRIEVLRGPQSGLYGADALGGVISITTKSGEGPPSFVGSVEGGSFGAVNERARFSGSEKNFNSAFSIDHLRSTDTPSIPLYLLKDGEKRLNDFYDNWTVSTKLGVNITNNLTFNTVARYTNSSALISDLSYDPNELYAPPDGGTYRYPKDYQQVFMRSEAVLTLFDGRVQNFFGLGYLYNQTNYPSYTMPNYSSPTLGGSENDGDRIKVDWRSVVKLAEGQTLILGLEDQNEGLQTTTIGSDLLPVSVNPSERDRAAYLEFQSEPFKRLFVVGNIRYDNNSTFGDATTWRFSTSYLMPGAETKIKGSVGTGFKAPDLYSRFVDYFSSSYNYFANPNLEPEENLGYDVGFEQPLFSNNLRLGATYFHNDLTNLIVTQNISCPPGSYDPFSCYTSVNLTSASTYGVETFLAWRASDNFIIRGDYTYTHTYTDTLVDPYNHPNDHQLLRRPKNKGSVTALWLPTSRLTLSATLLTVGPWIDFPRYGYNYSQSPASPLGYTVVNLASDYKINDCVSFYGRIDNLFNTTYEEPSGYLRPGLGAYVGLRFTGP